MRYKNAWGVIKITGHNLGLEVVREGVEPQRKLPSTIMLGECSNGTLRI